MGTWEVCFLVDNSNVPGRGFRTSSRGIESEGHGGFIVDTRIHPVPPRGTSPSTLRLYISPRRRTGWERNDPRVWVTRMNEWLVWVGPDYILKFWSRKDWGLPNSSKTCGLWINGVSKAKVEGSKRRFLRGGSCGDPTSVVKRLVNVPANNIKILPSWHDILCKGSFLGTESHGADDDPSPFYYYLSTYVCRSVLLPPHLGSLVSVDNGPVRVNLCLSIWSMYERWFV